MVGVALGDLRGDPAGAQLGAVTARVIRAVGEQRLGAKLAVRAPTGTTRSTSSKSWVTSWQLAAVTVAASGIPLPAQIT